MTRLIAACLAFASCAAPRADPVLEGRVVDADDGRPLPCRLYLQGPDQTYYFAQSASAGGSAVEYSKQVASHPASIERHTTLSAHPFRAALPPGTYTLTVEHGKEYHVETRKVEVGPEGAEVVLRLRRWIDMAARGWYSGETHVHRMPDVLPNVMLAEDLNVALPLTSWVTESHTSPAGSNKAGASVMNDARVVEVDPTHVFYPRNTEYEIFRVGKKSHTLGAFFILNHRTLFEEGVPPVKPVAERARREGALLELDKHNWPWSMMLAPVLHVDLYELANNHLWETEFAFGDFGEPPPDFMTDIDRGPRGLTELGWLQYTFQNYYALLDCGLRMRPTAGCASGVHPVPLGFGRVYVHLDGPFGYDAWMKGLNEGRSFVTTGPMLFVSVQDGTLVTRIESAEPLGAWDLIVNGERRASYEPANRRVGGVYVNLGSTPLDFRESSWAAVRCFEDRKDGRPRWAHSAPVYVDVPGKPLRPRRAEAEFLLRRVEAQLARSREVLAPEALVEYKEAADFYRGKLEESR